VDESEEKAPTYMVANWIHSRRQTGVIQPVSKRGRLSVVGLPVPKRSRQSQPGFNGPRLEVDVIDSQNVLAGLERERAGRPHPSRTVMPAWLVTHIQNTLDHIRKGY
jgi:hypothetical protein